jgi:hypothetical protein
VGWKRWQKPIIKDQADYNSYQILKVVTSRPLSPLSGSFTAQVPNVGLGSWRSKERNVLKTYEVKAKLKLIGNFSANQKRRLEEMFSQGAIKLMEAYCVLSDHWFNLAGYKGVGGWSASDNAPRRATFNYIDNNWQLYWERLGKAVAGLENPDTEIVLQYVPGGPPAGGTGGTVIWMNYQYVFYGLFLRGNGGVINVSDDFFRDTTTVKDVYHELGRWFNCIENTGSHNIDQWDDVVRYLAEKFQRYVTVTSRNP